MRKSLQPEELGDLLMQARVAVLATFYPDGTTLLAPVWHEWRDGGFTVVVDGNDAKIRNLRRDPRFSIVVAEDDPPYRGIEVRGEARISETAAEAALRRLAERYLGVRAAGGYLTRMGEWAQQCVMLRLEP